MKKPNKNLVQKIALERIYRLMDLALAEWKTNPERSKDYLMLMKKISMRNKVKIPKEVKELYCKKCFSVLMDSADKETRIKGKIVFIKCRKCGNTKKVFPETKKEGIVFCVTGSIGTGKTTVLNELEKKGFTALNADKIAKQEMNKVKEELTELFGRNAVTKQGIDFKFIAGIAFNDRKKLMQLNELVHPLVEKKLREELKGRTKIAVEIPLLFEAGMERLCDKIIVVTAKKEKLIERKEKHGMKKEETEKRLANQFSQKEKTRKADYVIDNNGSLKELQEKINKVVK